MPGSRNISCDEALNRIFDYIDDHLKETSRDELERHLEACRHCFDRVHFEKQLKSRLRRLTPRGPSDRLRRRVEDLVDQF